MLTQMNQARFNRYDRVRHRRTHEYCNVVGPGASVGIVLVASGFMLMSVPAEYLRPVRWYERLLNR